ncbi:MAG TPA: hypothetical protein VNL14_16590 [Candidatus Acidoferrales bacterium]|nr:hypothetical protein [Candidatus Acidoferrales bacterium]
MQIVSREEGIFLVFRDTNELSVHLQNLQDMREHMVATKEPGPHVYAIFKEGAVPRSEVNIAMHEVKRAFTK